MVDGGGIDGGRIGGWVCRGALVMRHSGRLWPTSGVFAKQRALTQLRSQISPRKKANVKLSLPVKPAT